MKRTSLQIIRHSGKTKWHKGWS